MARLSYWWSKACHVGDLSIGTATGLPIYSSFRLPFRGPERANSAGSRFGEWLQAGDDVLLPLRQRVLIVEAQVDEDPLLRLPANYRIGLFTLQRGSAERAREMMLGRNPALDIRLCCETDFNSSGSCACTTFGLGSYRIFLYYARNYLRHYSSARGARSCLSRVRAAQVVSFALWRSTQ